MARKHQIAWYIEENADRAHGFWTRCVIAARGANEAQIVAYAHAVASVYLNGVAEAMARSLPYPQVPYPMVTLASDGVRAFCTLESLDPQVRDMLERSARIALDKIGERA